jgi:hypothetical protein
VDLDDKVDLDGDDVVVAYLGLVPTPAPSPYADPLGPLAPSPTRRTRDPSDPNHRH